MATLTYICIYNIDQYLFRFVFNPLQLQANVVYPKVPYEAPYRVNCIGELLQRTHSSTSH